MCEVLKTLRLPACYLVGKNKKGVVVYERDQRYYPLI